VPLLSGTADAFRVRTCTCRSSNGAARARARAVAAHEQELMARAAYQVDLGPTSLELAQMAHRFQVEGLYQHFVRNFREGLCPGNVVEWLVQVHDSGLAALEDGAMDYVRANALTFQVQFACL